jgi:hypothetical protein
MALENGREHGRFSNSDSGVPPPPQDLSGSNAGVAAISTACDRFESGRGARHSRIRPVRMPRKLPNTSEFIRCEWVDQRAARSV